MPGGQNLWTLPWHFSRQRKKQKSDLWEGLKAVHFRDQSNFHLLVRCAGCRHIRQMGWHCLDGEMDRQDVDVGDSMRWCPPSDNNHSTRKMSGSSLTGRLKESRELCKRRFSRCISVIRIMFCRVTEQRLQKYTAVGGAERSNHILTSVG